MGCAAEKYDFIAKSFDGDFKDTDFNNRIISGWISKYEVDRDGEVVKPTAFEKHLEIYKSNGPLLMFHLHRSLPVGKVVEVKIFPDEGVWASFYITKNPTGDEILQLIREGCLKGFSAGFVPIRFEDNPPEYKIPTHVIKTAMGRKVRKQYLEVEWVETSLLPIPSNRSSLIEYAEKGNQIAGLIAKSFDIDKFDDLELVIKEWVDANTLKYTLKSLWVEKAFWDESEHPRDNTGQFADKNKLEYKPTDQKIDEVIHRQKQMQDSLDEIKDKDSWSSWFKKWAVRVGVAVGGYYLFKHRKKSEAYNEVSKRSKEKINEWLSKKVKETISNSTKGFEHDEEIDKVLSLMDQIEVFLKKGKELGLEEEQEYQNIQKFYNRNYEILKRIAGNESKGLSSLWVVEKQYGLSSLITKEMSKGEFKEEEHPRANDGKFRKKNEGSNSSTKKTEKVKNNKVIDPRALEKKQLDEKYKDFPETRPTTYIDKAIGIGVAGITLAYGFKKHNKNALGAVFAAYGAGATAFFGYNVATRSSLFQRSENKEQVKLSVEEITKACPKPNPNKNAISTILNLEVENRVYTDKNRTRFQQQLIDYVNSDQLQKDLSERFGHLEEGGSQKIVLYSHPQMNFLNPLNMLRNNVCYSPMDDKIYINVAIHDDIAKAIDPNITPKDLIMHEYAHSITFVKPEMTKKYTPEYEGFVKSLVGKQLDLPDWIELPEKWIEPTKDDWGEGVETKWASNSTGRKNYEIVDYEIKTKELKPLLEEVKGYFGKDGQIAFEKNKDAINVTAILKLKDENGKIKELDTMGILDIMHYYGMTSTHEDPVKDIAENAVKIKGIEHRRIYGLSNVSEWVSVKVEKREKI